MSSLNFFVLQLKAFITYFCYSCTFLSCCLFNEDSVHWVFTCSFIMRFLDYIALSSIAHFAVLAVGIILVCFIALICRGDFLACFVQFISSYIFLVASFMALWMEKFVCPNFLLFWLFWYLRFVLIFYTFLWDLLLCCLELALISRC